MPRIEAYTEFAGASYEATQLRHVMAETIRRSGIQSIRSAIQQLHRQMVIGGVQ
jgi:hypothetical protein